MSESSRWRGWVSFQHFAAGMVPVLAVGIAGFLGLLDIGAGAMTALLTFPALIFFVGRPHGQAAWLIAVFAALLILMFAGLVMPGLRSFLGGAAGLLLVITVVPFSGLAIGIVRERSGLLSALAGLGLAGMTVVLPMAGAKWILDLSSQDLVLRALLHAIVFSAIPIPFAMFTASWWLGRHRTPLPAAEEDAA